MVIIRWKFKKRNYEECPHYQFSLSSHRCQHFSFALVTGELYSVLLSNLNILLKDKLRHSKTFEFILRKNLFQPGSGKPGVIRSALLAGARQKTSTENVWKQRKELVIGCSLKPS